MATYATPAQLRAEYVPALTPEVLSDASAEKLLSASEDLIDDALGARPIDTDTGRKVRLSDYESDGWQLAKLRDATTALAKRLSQEPDLAEGQLYTSVSGEVSVSGPRGSRYGARVEALLNASGLRRPTTQASPASGRVSTLPRIN